MMPMTETHSTLRQSLIPGLLNTVQYNVARKQKDLKLLEIGRVFFGSGDDNIQPKETLYLSGALTGEENSTKWLKESSVIDFYTAKGYLEVIFERLGLDEKVSSDKDLNETYVFEINLDEVISESKVKPKYEEVTKYPEITRDIAMLVDLKDEYQNIYDVIESINSKLITKVELFDLYVGPELLVGKKSIALTITYSDKQKTLTDEEVTKVHEKVLKALDEYGAIKWLCKLYCLL